MAIVQNPITGRTRKKFGTAVFSKHYENNTMRSKPIQVANPRTEGQVRQRSKFAQTVDLIRQVLPVVNDAYSNTLKNMSPFNKIVSLNVKNIFGEGTNEIDYTKKYYCFLPPTKYYLPTTIYQLTYVIIDTVITEGTYRYE